MHKYKFEVRDSVFSMMGLNLMRMKSGLNLILIYGKGTLIRIKFNPTILKMLMSVYNELDEI
jgi:hypothetical protein